MLANTPRAALLVSALALAPSLAAAQDFFVDGLISLEVSDGWEREGSNLIDLGFGIAPGGASPFGFEFGVFGHAYRSEFFDNTDLIGFAALTVALGGGELHLGLPRSAVRGVSHIPARGGARAAEINSGMFNGESLMSDYYSAYYAEPMTGVRYERQTGALFTAISFGHIREVGNLTGLGLVYEGTSGRVFGAYEQLHSESGDIRHAEVGAAYRFGGGTSSLPRTEVGGAVNFSDTFFDVTTTSLYATTALADRLDMTALIAQRHSWLGVLRMHSLSASYDLWNGVRLNVGAHGDHTSSQLTWVMGLSRDF